jgi:hypothetical protein
MYVIKYRLRERELFEKNKLKDEKSLEDKKAADVSICI